MQYIAYDTNVIDKQEIDGMVNNSLLSSMRQASEILHADIHASVTIN